ncbi:MAG: DUF502 domain-containing protein [Gemmatimonadetes bacterium]|nr:MAG: DUF502 domain-containing protein [Gemmatimonadota bacterium]
MSLKSRWLHFQVKWSKLSRENVKQKIWNYVRVRFLTGVATLLPLFLTIWTFTVVLKFFDGFLGPYIYARFGVTIPGLGILATILLIFVWGVFTSNIVGRRILSWQDALIRRIPFAGIIYSGTQQLISALASGRQNEFRGAVLFEYPRRGLYVIGFVTKESSGELQAKTEDRLTNVFVPTTPNPTSGFLILVPQTDLIPLEMSVEDAMKVVISGGIVMPDYKPNQANQKLPENIGETPPPTEEDQIQETI